MEISVSKIEANDENRNVHARLLNAAEELFAEKGFNGTSIREITSEAQSNVAAVNYHFGGKENIYREVFRRRLIMLRELRIASIEKVMSQRDHEPTLEELIRAFASSFIAPGAGDGHWRRFRNLMIREISDPHLPKKMFMDEMITPTMRALLPSLEQLCPGLERRKLVLSTLSIVGQLVHAININEFFSPSDSTEVTWPDLNEMVEYIVEFSTAAIRAIAGENNSQKK